MAGIPETEHPNVRERPFSGNSGRQYRTTRELDLTLMTGLQTSMATTLQAIHGRTVQSLSRMPLRGRHSSCFHIVRFILYRSTTICLTGSGDLSALTHVL